MAYKPNNLSCWAYSNGASCWHYRTTDQASTVFQRGYFNGAAGQLRVGDPLRLLCGPDHDRRAGWLTVTRVTRDEVEICADAAMVRLAALEPAEVV